VGPIATRMRSADGALSVPCCYDDVLPLICEGGEQSLLPPFVSSCWTMVISEPKGHSSLQWGLLDGEALVLVVRETGVAMHMLLQDALDQLEGSGYCKDVCRCTRWYRA
jgi:hypothetical protein